jgi:cellulose biosynthesis protein BcsQ
MDWSTLEDEIPKQKNRNTIHQLDGMINNLKKVIRTSKSSTYVLIFFFIHLTKYFIRSKPRLSVHERQKQRFAGTTATPVILANSDIPQSIEVNSIAST